MVNEVVKFAVRFGINLDWLRIDPIDIGYEDHNFVLTRRSEGWVIKVFRADRCQADVLGLVDAIVAARHQGVRHPPLLKDQMTGSNLSRIGQLAAICMERVNGQSLFESNSSLGMDDVEDIVDQLCRLRRVRCVRESHIDPWSFRSHFRFRYETDSVSDPIDQAAIQLSLRRYLTLDESTFARGFVHGDLVPTNILRGEALNLIDFGRCGIRPYVDDIAILIAQSFFSGEPGCRYDVIEQFVGTLRSQSLLSDIEFRALPMIIGAVNATYMLAASQLALASNLPLSGETLYWYERSRNSLEWSRNWLEGR